MTQRNRRRQRRRGGIGGKLRWSAGRSSSSSRSAVIAVTSWVLDVAAEAPSLAACKQVERSGNSVVYAADGSKLGRDRLRRSARAGLDRAHPQAAAAGHGRDRGPALLRTRRRRPRGHPARRGEEPGSRQDGRGRLDDHPAAGPQPLHPQPQAQPRTQDHRGEAGDRVRRTPLAPAKSSASTSTPPPTGRSKASTAVGVGAAARIYFSQAGLEAEPARRRRCWPGCRRRPPTTTRSSTRARRRQRRNAVLAKMAKLGYSRAGARPAGARRAASGSTSPAPTSPTASPTSSTTSNTS